MGLSNSPLCSYCNLENEVPLHLFYECSNTQRLWAELQNALRNMITLPNLTEKSAPLWLLTDNKAYSSHFYHDII